jgi:hypothetical protein
MAKILHISSKASALEMKNPALQKITVSFHFLKEHFSLPGCGSPGSIQSRSKSTTPVPI